MLLLDVSGLKIWCWNSSLLKNFTWQRGREGYGACCWFGSEWHEVLCSPSWSPWEPMCWPGSERPNLQVQITWKKSTYWPVQILLLSEVLLLSHKLLRNGFGWRKAHFHLRMQCDRWLIWMCKKNLGTPDCWAAGPAAWDQRALGWPAWLGVAFMPCRCGVWETLETDVLEVCV